MQGIGDIEEIAVSPALLSVIGLDQQVGSDTADLYLEVQDQEQQRKIAEP